MQIIRIYGLLNLELKGGANVPLVEFVGFQPRDRQNPQNLNDVSFCSLPRTTGQGIKGTKNYPDAGIIISFDVFGFFRGYGQMKEAFRALTTDDTFQPCITYLDSEILMVVLTLDVNFMSSIYNTKEISQLLNRWNWSIFLEGWLLPM